MEKRIVVLDTETTGLSPTYNRIIEIGAIELIDGKKGRIFNKYINPGVSLPTIITNITGLTDEMLADKPVFSSIAHEFLDFIGDSEIVAHNAKFDIGFINSEFNRMERPPLTNRVTCSMLLFRSKYPGEKASLDALLKFFNISTERNKHGALLDASLLVDVYLKMV